MFCSLPIHLLRGILLPSLGRLWVKLPWTLLLCRILWVLKLSVPSGKYQEMQLLHHCKDFLSVFRNCQTAFHSGYYHFSFPPAINGSSCYLASLTTLGTVGVLDFDPSNRSTAVSHLIIVSVCIWHMMWSICSYVYLPSVYYLW